MENQNHKNSRAPYQEPPTEEAYHLKPNNWLWQSIVATIFCCLPFGIVGIIYAAKVDSLYYTGKYAEAERWAKYAKTWTLIAFAVGIIYMAVSVYFASTGRFLHLLDEIRDGGGASGYNF